jgi:hypothetical protein
VYAPRWRCSREEEWLKSEKRAFVRRYERNLMLRTSDEEENDMVVRFALNEVV